ncbi:hypothetical protein [Enterocloster bolteae]|nr:hypothetical protein [Enterocloster bolteae]ASN97911.1 hypothetical protein CGC65_26565 [Enterocloster bolteae]ENZ49646.1 hypothetical protein HMPREF1095_05083 [Enterocloster bolteae 90A5]ENZ72024.1 hypothetical protein HMPREF1096_01493 [Enterocloster bolteae 90B7]KMW16440.1 hypothetical protein HMPREF9472_03258 [Enterocloster bolteae WAL-14578]PQL50793.1 hypothetical protein C5Z06_10905 [Enterocloster bolteae]
MSDIIFLNTFKENFEKHKNKRIVIYGLSYGTKLIVENFPDFNICGLMDGYRTDGSIYEKKILSYQEVIALQIDMIIIVARPNITELIRNRIAAFCKKNSIVLFSADGKKLNIKMNKLDNEYFSISRELLQNKIDTYDIISFDVFDTLLMRKTLQPKDIFSLVEVRAMKEKNIQCAFEKNRILAEQNLLASFIPNYLQIYNELQFITGISDDEKEYLMDLELRIESQMLIPRKEMVRVFDYAKSRNKKIYLISDMYLSSNWIGNQLKKAGIIGYDELMISNEYSTSKGQNLFNVFIHKVKDKKILHIGDSEAFDIMAAQRNGIDNFRILSAYDMLQISVYKEVLYEIVDLTGRLQVGYFISRIFNSPFALFESDGKGRVKTGRDIGYIYMAPIITDFLLWLANKIKDKKSARVLFSARDGYLIDKLYGILRKKESLIKLPEGLYFLTSRILCISASLFNEDDILWSMNNTFSGSPEELLKKRYFLTEGEIEYFDPNKYSSISQYILAHKKAILSKSAEIREKYMEYISGLGLNGDDDLIFFDFVSTGTCQLCLSRLLNADLKGYYFYRFNTMDIAKQKLLIEAPYTSEGILAANSLLLECILTSFVPTVKGFDSSGKPVYLEERRTEEELCYIKEVQDGIVEYFEDFIKYRDVDDLDAKDISLGEIFLKFITPQYSTIINNIFRTYIIDDEFHNENLHVSNIYQY